MTEEQAAHMIEVLEEIAAVSIRTYRTLTNLFAIVVVVIGLSIVGALATAAGQ